MTEVLSQLINTISPTALPLVVVILGLYYIYKKIGNERALTKSERDKDSQELHDTLLKLQFKVTDLDGRTVHHADLLEDLRNQVATLNTNIAVLGQQINTLVEVIKEHK